MKEIRFLAAWLFLSSLNLSAQHPVITDHKQPGFFPIVSSAGPTAIFVDKNDFWLVHKAAELLQQDLESITGIKTPVISEMPASADFIIMIGSQDSSATV